MPLAIGVRQLTRKEATDPVFAASAAADIAAYGAIFAVLTGLWCYAAYRLVNHPSIGVPVRRYAPRLVPFVLIGLGLWILCGLP